MKCTICEHKESTHWLINEKAGSKEPICLDCKMALEEVISQGMKLKFEFKVIDGIRNKQLVKRR